MNTPQIANCKKNIMGTVSFTGKFPKMRKAQDFIVYPIQDAPNPENVTIKVQSDTRIGLINLFSGACEMSQPHQGGAYFIHLATDKKEHFMINREECMMLKGWIKSKGGVEVGNNGVMYCDNTGAISL